MWGLNQHHKWFHATAESTSIRAFEMCSFGRRHVYRDGIIYHVTEFSYDIGYDAHMMHQSFAATVTDAAGRMARVNSETLGSAQVGLDPAIYLNEAGVRLPIDGEPGSGWCEFCWNRNYFDRARACEPLRLGPDTPRPRDGCQSRRPGWPSWCQ
ncbi:hypothetical protein [Mycobacterium sp. OTB74]|uniref:DUF7064 domain-containing protein n=1 Tax=Mycobacterium sp. OTB74 TaxID=1853452 RepID=UPI0024763D14|nr:hypothetical protein [Mycobacterium sp. OTB74]MDH6245070.1 hypothetical protein [Mycobacterium sp. OTB74]